MGIRNHTDKGGRKGGGGAGFLQPALMGLSRGLKEYASDIYTSFKNEEGARQKSPFAFL